ncbi:hypothetical protein DL95DRAFT_451970 [Leptodontidium sp. 2 PMI_412]|nr:hypothetical protein DL95DRAFT_451970 [Leptodontidium sp. 2 PMI_412]
MSGTCSGTQRPNCTAREFIVPDPDIAGIGVVLSFLIINAFTILVVICSVFIIEIEKFELNDVDVAIYKKTKDHLRLLRARMSEDAIRFWLGTLEKILLGLSDTQLLFGIGILITGYTMCNITVHHSNIVVILAWFASGTCLSSMNILKSYLNRYPATKISRLVLTLTLGGLLLSLNILQSHPDWEASNSLPAQCLFAGTNTRFSMSKRSAAALAFNITAIFLGYGTAIISLFPGLHVVIKKSLKISIDRLIQAISSKISLGDLKKNWFAESHNPSIISTLSVICRTIYGLLSLFILLPLVPLLYILYLLMTSYLMMIFFDIFWFAIGIYQLWYQRRTGRRNMEEEDKNREDAWAFGQLMPMILVFLPLMGAWATCYEACCDSRLIQNGRPQGHGIQDAAAASGVRMGSSVQLPSADEDAATSEQFPETTN